MESERGTPRHQTIRSRDAYRPKFEVSLFFENYEVRTLATEEEIRSLEGLRRIHLKNELKNESVIGLLIDESDFSADHLVVFDRNSERPIAAVKLITADHATAYDSDRLFKLDELKSFPGQKVELSKMAFDPKESADHIMALIIRGIERYAVYSQSELIFGSAGFRGLDTFGVARLYRFLAHNKMLSRWFFALPFPTYRVPSLYDALRSLTPSASLSEIEAKKMIPYRLTHFLQKGSVICSEPAYDPVYKNFTFLIALKTAILSAKLAEEKIIL